MKLSSPEWQRARVDAMVLMRSMGDVAWVESWLRDDNVQSAGRNDMECISKITACQEWLVGAKDYEAIHGPGSLLDKEHPFWLETIAPLRERMAAITQSR